MKCPYNYYLGEQEGYYLAGKVENLRRNWGKAYHDSLDEYDYVIFQGGGIDDAIQAAFKQVWNWKDSLTPSPEDEGDWDKSRTFDTLLRAIVWYAEEYKDSPLVLAALPGGEPATEVRFEVPIGDGPYRISGRIDKQVLFGDLLYILDRKSTGKGLNQFYFDMYEPDTQALTYYYALSVQLGLPVAGFMIDACQALVKGNRFQRHIVSVTPSQLEMYEKSVVTAMDEANRYEEKGFWPQRYTGCGAFGGCQFRRVCKRSPEFHSEWLQRDFEKRSKKD